MPNTIIYGGAASPDAYQYRGDTVVDGATPVTLRQTTAIWAPTGWWGDALFRTCTVVVGSNVGVTLRLTPIVNGQPYDGTNGQPDSRVTFTLDPPAAGERTTFRTVVGMRRPITLAGVDQGAVVGLRGTWFQFQLDSIGVVVVPSGEVNPDLRFEGVELDPEPLRPTQQVVNRDG